MDDLFHRTNLQYLFYFVQNNISFSSRFKKKTTNRLIFLFYLIIRSKHYLVMHLIHNWDWSGRFQRICGTPIDP